ncbi:hypothetical protein ACFXG4_03850 [Nocardia sp. NPDC059246]
MTLSGESNDFSEQRDHLFRNVIRTKTVFSDDFNSEDEPDEPDCN